MFEHAVVGFSFLICACAKRMESAAFDGSNKDCWDQKREG